MASSMASVVSTLSSGVHDALCYLGHTHPFYQQQASHKGTERESPKNLYVTLSHLRPKEFTVLNI